MAIETTVTETPDPPDPPPVTIVNLPPSSEPSSDLALTVGRLEERMANLETKTSEALSRAETAEAAAIVAATPEPEAEEETEEAVSVIPPEPSPEPENAGAPAPETPRSRGLLATLLGLG